MKLKSINYVQKIIDGKIRNQNQPYYLRHSPPDLQLKTNKLLIQSNHDGITMYEWNIDGKSEFEIANTLQGMSICATSYIAKGASIEDAIEFIASSLIGQLKN